MQIHTVHVTVVLEGPCLFEAVAGKYSRKTPAKFFYDLEQQRRLEAVAELGADITVIVVALPDGRLETECPQFGKCVLAQQVIDDYHLWPRIEVGGFDGIDVQLGVQASR